ncbi:hypothetical protein [Paenibacillus gallinarum]|uniref:Uncharacterized protein n=1 Tax=Paenibacillus gallinarum TaxID=2762232 RepID=A0ABR8SYH1_9BACL|nr:hypothetical protein [Paenibacillus gallinarum]MBD7968528.1 hypothetical protein [Paenibacillus gallinarum]
MPYSTGLIYNSSGVSGATQILVTCLNDSPYIPSNIEIQVFKWNVSLTSRTPIGLNLIQVQPLTTKTLLYALSDAGYYEVQSDFFSATSSIIHVYGIDSAGGIIQRVLQSEMTYIDQFTITS